MQYRRQLYGATCVNGDNSTQHTRARTHGRTVTGGCKQAAQSRAGRPHPDPLSSTKSRLVSEDRILRQPRKPHTVLHYAPASAYYCGTHRRGACGCEHVQARHAAATWAGVYAVPAIHAQKTILWGGTFGARARYLMYSTDNDDSSPSPASKIASCARKHNTERSAPVVLNIRSEPPSPTMRCRDTSELEQQS